jgi:hypothetical protein
MSEALCRSLARSLDVCLRQRGADQAPLVARLDGRGVLFRPASTLPLLSPRSVRLEDLVEGEDMSWRPFGHLRGILYGALGMMPEVCQVRRGPEVLMPFLAARACGLADRLRQQLGGTEDGLEFRCGRGLAEAMATAIAGEREAPQARTCMTGWAIKLGVALGDRAAGKGRERPGGARILRFRLDPSGGLVVDWLDEDGGTLESESLLSFVEGVWAGLADTMQTDLTRLAKVKQEHVEAGARALEQVSPAVARLVESVRRKGQARGIRLYTARTAKGVVADVWLHLHAGTEPSIGGVGQCALSAYRGHREFVLQAAGGALYYFPPILLVARLGVEAEGVNVFTPSVRQPKGGYSWCHPYTGSLEGNPLGGTYSKEAATAALYEASEAARKRFPELSERRNRAGERALCLAGQEAEVKVIRQDLREQVAGDGEVDVLGVVTRLWNIARHGLCRGHQVNQSRPLAQLNNQSMPFPLRTKRISGELARRAFPYDPSNPGRLRAG